MDYAAVVSLVSTIDRLLKPSESKIVIPNSDKEFISEELSYWRSFLENIKDLPSSHRVDEPRVRDAAMELEDLIDSHLLSDPFPQSQTSTDDHQHIPTLVRQEITCFTETLKANEEYHYPSHASDIVSDSSAGKKKMIVGFKFNEQLHQLKSMISSHCWELPKQLPELRQEEITWFTDQTLKEYGCSHAPSNVTGKKKTILGVKFNEQLDEFKSLMLKHGGNLDFIFVIGMAGTGKTTLVQEIYNDPLVTRHFELCLFLQIGPKYKLEGILRILLGQLDVYSDKSDSVEKLCHSLYRSLFHAKYLMVLEDMWDTGVWKMLVSAFPDKENGSRIIVTTQIDSFSCDGTMYNFYVPFLEDGESWSLLREMVFTSEERCSLQLEKMGKKIAKKCEGLPLAIIQVGELLNKTEKTVQKWEEIAEKEDPIDITIEDNTPLSEALCLSYWMLPQYLKVCFLYMAVFPKGYEITRTRLIQLWVSEGLFHPETFLTVEEKAESYLQVLVSRNVVLNDKSCSVKYWETKTCKLHFTFRNLCVSEAKRECLFPIIKKYSASLPADIDAKHRLCIHNNIVVGFEQVHKWMESAPNLRSLIFLGPRQQYPIALYLDFRLLKVLDALAIRFYEFPYQVLGLFHLRYLAITYDGDELPASLSHLWNLEVFIVHRHHIIITPNSPVYLPMEIWKLYKLKHLECIGYDLPDPSNSSSAADDSLILGKLLKIVGVSPKSCTRGVLARIPNLTRIEIQIVSAHDSVETFSFFGDQLASLYENFWSFKCVVINPNLHGPQAVPSSPIPINFPVNIVKITLSGCAFPWEYMRVIAALPKLEMLKLRWYAFSGPVWNLSEVYFPNLKFLLLQDLDIQHWKTEECHFPSLRRLIIRHCYELKTMPKLTDCFRPCLRFVEVHNCSQNASSWVDALQRYNIQLCLNSPRDDKNHSL